MASGMWELQLSLFGFIFAGFNSPTRTLKQDKTNKIRKQKLFNPCLVMSNTSLFTFFSIAAVLNILSFTGLKLSSQHQINDLIHQNGSYTLFTLKTVLNSVHIDHNYWKICNILLWIVSPLPLVMCKVFVFRVI